MTMVMDRITNIYHLFSCIDHHGHVWIKVIDEFKVSTPPPPKKKVKSNFSATIALGIFM